MAVSMGFMYTGLTAHFCLWQVSCTLSVCTNNNVKMSLLFHKLISNNIQYNSNHNSIIHQNVSSGLHFETISGIEDMENIFSQTLFYCLKLIHTLDAKHGFWRDSPGFRTPAIHSDHLPVPPVWIINIVFNSMKDTWCRHERWLCWESWKHFKAHVCVCCTRIL